MYNGKGRKIFPMSVFPLCRKSCFRFTETQHGMRRLTHPMSLESHSAFPVVCGKHWINQSVTLLRRFPEP